MINPAWIDGLQFPFAITIPATLFYILKARELTVNSPQDSIPAAIVAWMKSDLRYKGWFRS